MKSVGITRKIDTLGRIVLPMELRRSMGINVSDSLEIYVEGDYIAIKKYKPLCMFCKSSEDVREHSGRKICEKCVEELKSLPY